VHGHTRCGLPQLWHDDLFAQLASSVLKLALIPPKPSCEVKNQSCRWQAAHAQHTAAAAELSAAGRTEAEQAGREHGYGKAAAAATQHLELERAELEAARRHEQCCAEKVRDMWRQARTRPAERDVLLRAERA